MTVFHKPIYIYTYVLKTLWKLLSNAPMPPIVAIIVKNREYRKLAAEMGQENNIIEYGELKDNSSSKGCVSWVPDKHMFVIVIPKKTDKKGEKVLLEVLFHELRHIANGECLCETCGFSYDECICGDQAEINNL